MMLGGRILVQIYREPLYLWEKGYTMFVMIHSLCEIQTTISAVCRICWSLGPLLLDRIVHKFVINFDGTKSTCVLPCNLGSECYWILYLAFLASVD